MTGGFTPSVAGWWFLRATRADGTTAWFATVRSDRHPGGTVLTVDDAAAAVPDGGLCATVTCDRHGAVSQVRLEPVVAPKAPPLWFVELRESAATPPAVNLVAFTGHGVAPGRVLDEGAAREVGVSGADQVGAVRWYPATGEVDQIFIDPAWRRRSIAGALAVSGSAISRTRGWPGFWGDGQRTELGERWKLASLWADRMADLTHLAPPMDLPRQ